MVYQTPTNSTVTGILYATPHELSLKNPMWQQCSRKCLLKLPTDILPFLSGHLVYRVRKVDLLYIIRRQQAHLPLRTRSALVVTEEDENNLVQHSHEHSRRICYKYICQLKVTASEP